MPPKTFSLSDLTDEALARIVAQHAKAWRQDYAARFAAMVAEVKAYVPAPHVEPLT